ncbi:MAG TPA: hypothetical protein VK184_10175 [Nostocaceae cyanobacterium]|nr:hypothetical protein [Nostocaceae cyanobacterium]
MTKLYGCQQNLINLNEDLKAILEFICSESYKLTNSSIYYTRQLFFKTGQIIGKFDLEKEYKANNHYQVLYSQAVQRILNSVAESFRSFKKLDKKYCQGHLENQTRLTNYRKGIGDAVVTYPQQALKFVGNSINIFYVITLE